MTILEVQGIKCSSRSFQIELEIKQMMTLEPVNLFENCLLASNRPIVNQTKLPTMEQGLEETIEQENSEEPIQVDTSEVEEENDYIQQEETKEEENIHLEESKEEEPPKEISLEETPILEDSENMKTSEPSIEDLEFTVDLEKLESDESISIKPQNDIYYERYREAQKRARIAKNLALQAYLEAKEIKNQYHLDDIESDEDEFFQSSEIEEAAQ